MQIALVDDKRTEAFSGGRGLCPECGSETIAKCGPRNIHHWAHHRRKDCDPWWENETPWHRDWKNEFPVECREVSHVAENGEIHRADVKTRAGIVIEFQHSNMTDEERISREGFYGNLVWVVDGLGFRENFDIYHMLPDPDSGIAKDLVWSKAKRHMNGANDGIFFRLSEALQNDPGVTKATLTGGWVHGIREIKDDVVKYYSGHHQYDWVCPRKTWLDAQCPVYIDFGEEHLVKLGVYDSSKLKCIRMVSKRKFVREIMEETDAEI